MTAIDAISAQPAPVEEAKRNWARPAPDVKPFRLVKGGERSIAPQNLNAPTWKEAVETASVQPAQAEEVKRSEAKPSPNVKPARLVKGGERSIAPQNLVEPTWKDVADTVNPLHQLPIVGDVYRAITGEKISGVSRVLGGFLYGGISGGFIAAATAAYAEVHDDRSPGEIVVAMLLGNDKKPDAAPAPADKASVMLADATPPIQDKAQDTVLMARAESAAADKPEQAGKKSPITLVDAVPLRERLNHKNAAHLSTDAKPLSQYQAFIDRIPAGAANVMTAQNQNLQLLQGLIDPPSAAAAPDEAMAAGDSVGSHNPLPKDLIEDMMIGALDKYQRLHNVAENGQSGGGPAR
ncbi:MAG: hypothetical protein WDO70_03225 [Alphaproteobacteria bacterium]